eukprot:3906700-Rhodomonas_salina.1
MGRREGEREGRREKGREGEKGKKANLEVKRKLGVDGALREASSDRRSQDVLWDVHSGADEERGCKQPPA